jgi:hypothetical protein
VGSPIASELHCIEYGTRPHSRHRLDALIAIFTHAVPSCLPCLASTWPVFKLNGNCCETDGCHMSSTMLFVYHSVLNVKHAGFLSVKKGL